MTRIPSGRLAAFSAATVAAWLAAGPALADRGGLSRPGASLLSLSHAASQRPPSDARAQGRHAAVAAMRDGRRWRSTTFAYGWPSLGWAPAETGASLTPDLIRSPRAGATGATGIPRAPVGPPTVYWIAGGAGHFGLRPSARVITLDGFGPAGRAGRARAPDPTAPRIIVLRP